MKKLDLYVAKEMVLPFFLGTFVILLMFQANTYMWMAENYNVKNIPILAQFQFIFYMTPGFLRMTLPAAAAFASSLAVTRLARDSEVTIMRTAGVSILRILLPIFAFGALAAVINFYNVETVVPLANRKVQDLQSKNAFLGTKAVFKSNAFLQLGNYAASLGTVEERGDDQLEITKVLLIDRSDNRITSFYTADRGRYRRGIFTFPNAVGYAVDENGITEFRAKTITITQDLNFSQFFNSSSAAFGQEGKTTEELRKIVDSGRKLKIDYRASEIELDLRYAVPFACIIFSITSPIFAISFARSGGFAGVLVSFAVVMLYYNSFMISTQILSKLDWIPAILIAWLPNLLFGGLGLLGIRRLE